MFHLTCEYFECDCESLEQVKEKVLEALQQDFFFDTIEELDSKGNIIRNFGCEFDVKIVEL